LVREISVNPLARAVRVDKLALAALASVTAAWKNPGDAAESIPVISMLTEGVDVLAERAARLLELIEGELDRREIRRDDIGLQVVDDPSEAGGGSMPAISIPGISISVTSKDVPADEIHLRLRNSEPPVVARVAEGSVHLHMRTLFKRDLEPLANSLCDAVASTAMVNRYICPDCKGGEQGP
jgi:L-seryl-tRNA(Ser) seleniumtransferase